MPENKPQIGVIQAGTTTYYVGVHFGQTKLETILKRRILGSARANPEPIADEKRGKNGRT